MAGVRISANQVRRLAREVGHELIAQRDQKVVEHRRRQLEPRTEVIPEAVVVEIDGGRIRTRAAGAGPGVHEAQNKEDKVACLATLSGPTFGAGPCPEPPDAFPCPRRVRRLVAQMKGPAGGAPAPENRDEPAPAVPPVGNPGGAARWSPARLVRTCVASTETSASFGPMVAAGAQERHFYAARRRALVADRAAHNWPIHRGYFGDFEPITDFLHAVCYVFSSAVAVRAGESSGWSQYLEWMHACWPGRAGAVLAELDQWQARLGEPPPGEAQTAGERRDPRRVVAQARSYLGHNQERTDYPRYRRHGLPTTSSSVESLVGEVNARVKANRSTGPAPPEPNRSCNCAPPC
jgi:hypothetical protein